MDSRTKYPGAAWVAPEQAALARSVLTYPNPAHETAVAHGGGNVPRTLNAYRDTGSGGLWVPRLCNLPGIEVAGYMREAQDRPVGWPVAGLDLRDYQAPAVRAMVATGSGVLVAPPGSGKTIMGLAAARMIDRPILVLVHAHELADQWIDASKKVLGVEAVRIAEPGEAPPVAVVLVQALAKWTDSQIVELGSEYDVLLVDEAHHSPAETWERLLWLMLCAHRFGLTATPDRRDGLTPMLHLHLGPVVHRVQQSTMVASGASVLPHVVKVEHTITVPVDMKRQVMIHPRGGGWPIRRKASEFIAAEEIYNSAGMSSRVAVWTGVPDEVADHAVEMIKHRGWEASSRLDDYAGLIRAVKSDPERLALIVSLALRCAAEGSTLILCQHVDYAEAIAAAVTEAGVECKAIHAKVRPAKERRLRLERLRSGDLLVATASTLADEYLDVRCLSRGILALPRRDQAKTQQNVGRLMRAEEGKPTPVWYDIVDSIPGQSRGGPFVSQWWSRMRAYKGMGLEVTR